MPRLNITLPEPDCRHGYTRQQIEDMFSEERFPHANMLKAFDEWMTGQTVMLCEGRKFNHDTREYEPSACADNPHGIVCYKDDVERFVRGLPVID